ncbi:sialate O-acetylesterase [Acuticoccus sp.]|uniref:sialate O-acetylesterase n=1 Tax=Acuticoccus sp. TaxID=1904378 RepID=UPI003B524B2D
MTMMLGSLGFGVVAGGIRPVTVGIISKIRVDVSGNTAAVSWDPPRITGGAITGYVLQVSDDGGSRWTTLSTPTAPSAQDGAWRPGRLYRAASLVESYPSKEARAGDGDARTVHVVLLAGQSNMVGAAVFDGGADYPSGVLAVSGDALVQASSPLDHPASTADDPRTLGPSLGFAIDFAAARPDEHLVLVPAAVGGTSFADDNWNPGDHNFAQAVARSNTAVGLRPHARFTILWAQGISDALAEQPDVDAYAGRLDAMIAGLRGEVAGALDAPIFLAALPPAFVAGGSKAAQVNAAIVDTPKRVANAIVVPTDNLTLEDEYHYDAPSYRALGRRFYAAFAGEPIDLRGPGSGSITVIGGQDEFTVSSDETIADISATGGEEQFTVEKD